MDKKSKILFAVFALLIVGSVAVTYWKIMVKKDYIIEAQTDCDPYTEKCFLWECDPESTEEGEACVEDPEENSWYFQVVKRNASRIPLCDPNDEECDALTCGENEPECEYIFCDEANMEEQYASACNDPIVYTQENPVEEEECDPEIDEECVVEEDCDPEVDEECVIEDECDPEADEECVVEEDVVAEDETVAPCDAETADVCPVSVGTSTAPELE